MCIAEAALDQEGFNLPLVIPENVTGNPQCMLYCLHVRTAFVVQNFVREFVKNLRITWLRIVGEFSHCPVDAFRFQVLVKSE
jgi:hypothetical protein